MMDISKYAPYVPSNWDDLDFETRYAWIKAFGLSSVTNAYQDAILRLIDAMRHDLETSAGLYCVDHQPENEPDAFQLQHKSLNGVTKEPDWSGYRWIFGE